MSPSELREALRVARKKKKDFIYAGIATFLLLIYGQRFWLFPALSERFGFSWATGVFLTVLASVDVVLVWGGTILEKRISGLEAELIGSAGPDQVPAISESLWAYRNINHGVMGASERKLWVALEGILGKGPAVDEASQARIAECVYYALARQGGRTIRKDEVLEAIRMSALFVCRFGGPGAREWLRRTAKATSRRDARRRAVLDSIRDALGGV